ncbi:MAG: hypothetical protein HZA20_01485 [Nitrospirae bacterium]|nr:hypothetical protein [Nitrospirota bacterium]
MKKLSAVVILVAGLFILISCSRGPASEPVGGTSRVTIAVTNGQPAADANRSVRAASIPSDVAKMVFSISATDMIEITRETVVSGGVEISEAFEIPIGAARRFEARAYDGIGTLLFSGEKLADLDGSPKDVTIEMQWRQPDSGIYHIGGLINSASAAYAMSGVFGDSSPARGLFPSASGDGKGLVLLPADSAFTIAIPQRFRQAGVLLELQVNYMDGHLAKFSIEDDIGNLVGASDLVGDVDENQTYTWQIDLSPVFTENHTPESLTLKTVSSVRLNAYAGFYKIEAANESGVFIADLREGGSRVISSNAQTSYWGGGTDCITEPANFATCGYIEFSLSDAISSMTRPVLEFNFGREEDSQMELSLYTSNEDMIGRYYSDDDDDEEMGQTFIVDVTDYKTVDSFYLSMDCSTFLNPFVKVYDAAATSGGSIMLDITPTGANHVSHSGKFGYFLTSLSGEVEGGYPVNGMFRDNIGYDAPHWLADPTNEPYGQDGELVFSLPEVVKNLQNPVLEIMHFAPDSVPHLASPSPVEGDPAWYPVEFYLLDEHDTEIAHVYFGQWEDDAGGVLKNQIPIRDFRNSATLKIKVPADSTRWSQAAFPGFIKIFNAIERTVSVAPAETLSLSPDTAALTGCGGTGEGRQAVFTAAGGSPPYEWSSDGMGSFVSNYGDDDTKAFWDDSTYDYCNEGGTVTITVSDSTGATATATIAVQAGD